MTLSLDFYTILEGVMQSMQEDEGGEDNIYIYIFFWTMPKFQLKALPSGVGSISKKTFRQSP